MIDIHDIPKEKPSKYESQQKLRKYKLKSRLGLFELFDEDSNIENILLEAGYLNLLDYERDRFKALTLIDDNKHIPKDIMTRLLRVQQLKQIKRT